MEQDHEDEERPRERMIILVCQEDGNGNNKVTMRFKVAMASATVESMVNVNDDDEHEHEDAPAPEVPLPPVKPATMRKIAEYLDYHHDTADTEETMAEWDARFVDVPDEELFAVITAANFLEVKPLLDVTCQRVAFFIRECATPQAIRRRFGIVNDFTPEEEAQVASEIEWVESV